MLLFQGNGYVGDYRKDREVNMKWTTHNNTDGENITATHTVYVYKDDDEDETTDGVTTSTSFDGIVGFHNVKIDLTESFYESEKDYQVVAVSTIDGESVNLIVGLFSINNRA
jgi:hypothetical protein